eukprot:CAMPEP_0201492742 /NCGR_PEP_ID=MMETSP0151_2-20130828/34559_1 /ASSEMBLY_ACC=CAM_ASM_000257 /TAXON_ID=200890 /ORGANISM="Paramoeba atlantica, Strain 621/1 / CCAP 1560/9" /LENGTH=555 /DNA_ID=CAMNT_0047879743 /DNA_START=254 /DNA_END=1921 /DNA_ORIENTATION=-
MAEAVRLTVQEGDVYHMLSLLVSIPQLIHFEGQNGETPLYTACRFGRVSVVSSLVSLGADVNRLLSNGDHNLMASAKMGHADVTELLLQNGANANFQRPNGSSPLFISAQNGHVGVVETLLRYSAVVDLRRCTGTPALYMACQRGHKEVVTTLLRYGADPKLVNNKGRSALHAAAYNGHYEVVKILIEAGADPHLKDQDDDTPFSDASMHGHHDILNLFQSHDNFSVNEVAHAEILAASYNGEIEKISHILETTKDVLNHPVGTPALFFAAERGLTAVVEFLVVSGASVNLVNKAGKTALHAAAVHGHYRIVQILLVAGADVSVTDENSQTAEDMAYARHHDHVAWLLRANSTTTWNLWSDLKETYFQWLPYEMTTMSVDLLLKPPGGEQIKSGFIKAVQNGNIDRVTLFLRSYPSMASLSIPGKSHSALSIAASSGHTSIVKILLQCGASVNATHQRGRTALHEAAATGSFDVAQILLLAGADVTLRDEDSLSAYDLAKRAHYKEISSLLKKWNKNIQVMEHRCRKREASREKLERKMSRVESWSPRKDSRDRD